MTNTKILALVFTAAGALALAGCSDKCPTEAPGGAVQQCTAAAGQPVTVKVQPCQKCNQSGTSCQVDIQGNFIQLDLTTEACEDGSSCPPACELSGSVTCSFDAPAAAGTYSVRLYDPTANSFEPVASLTVTSGGAPSCDLL